MYERLLYSLVNYERLTHRGVAIALVGVIHYESLAAVREKLTPIVARVFCGPCEPIKQGA
jgi:hypothetical protein